MSQWVSQWGRFRLTHFYLDSLIRTAEVSQTETSLLTHLLTHIIITAAVYASVSDIQPGGNGR